MRKLLLSLSLISGAVLANQQGFIGQTADLRSGPFSDAKTVQGLLQGTNVEVLQRQGGWYKVKAKSAEGWVRMSAVRFSTGGSGMDAVELIKSGRASARKPTASTGVRALDEDDLDSARPNPAAVQSLEQLAVAPQAAQAFAASASLRADPGLFKE